MAEGKIEVNINTEIIDNNSQYSKARRRMYNMFHRDLSDKEIIEKLCDEIDYYRGKIIRHEEEHKKDSETLDTTNESIDEDIEEIITDTIYADGKVRKIITEYKYKHDEVQNDCPKIPIGFH